MFFVNPLIGTSHNTRNLVLQLKGETKCSVLFVLEYSVQYNEFLFCDAEYVVDFVVI